MRRPAHRPLHYVALLAALPLVLTACGGADDGGAGDATPHGYVEGASEQPEPQLALLGVDDDGAATLLDLLSGETSDVAELGDVEQTDSDGRFVAATTADGIAVVDSGRWTVDHGDHSHYYRAEPRLAATLDDLDGSVGIASTETLTVVHAQGSGRVVVLDRSALGQGEVDEVASFDAPGATAAEPLGESVVLADDDGVKVVGLDGEQRGEATACTDPADAITTRVGVAVSCAEGAVLVTEEDAEPETIAYPDGTDTATRATTLDARASRPTVAGVAGDDGVWLLDTRERTWELVETDQPVVRAVAVDDSDEHVVTIDTSGAVVVLTADGEEVGRTDAVVAGVDEPTLEVDASRAYVATDGGVLEIDFADAARVARTLDLTATHVAEVG